MSVISYPIPAYQNLPIQPQFYEPSAFFISNITLGPTTVVTTTVNHNYVIGQTCRLIIPQYFGCRQLNELQGNVIAIPAANQVTLDIFSAGGTPFNTSSVTTQPQILAIGSVNSGPINANGPKFEQTYIPGSFINIPPL